MTTEETQDDNDEIARIVNRIEDEEEPDIDEDPDTPHTVDVRTHGILTNEGTAGTIDVVEVSGGKFSSWDYTIDSSGWTFSGTYTLTLENTSSLPVIGVSVAKMQCLARMQDKTTGFDEKVGIPLFEKLANRVGFIMPQSTKEVDIDFEITQDTDDGSTGAYDNPAGLAYWAGREGWKEHKFDIVVELRGMYKSKLIREEQKVHEIKDPTESNSLETSISGPTEPQEDETVQYDYEGMPYADRYEWYSVNEAGLIVKFTDDSTTGRTWNSIPDLSDSNITTVFVKAKGETQLGWWYTDPGDAYATLRIDVVR